MSVLLVDRRDPSRVLRMNLWNWRTVIAAVGRLAVLPPDTLMRLEPYCGGLDRDEARRVADAVRSRLLPAMDGDERLMIDGTASREVDDGTFHRTPETMALNYSIPRDRLEAFAAFCAACDGFDV